MKLIVLFILATLIIVAPLGNAFSESDAEGHSSSIRTAPLEDAFSESDVEGHSSLIITAPSENAFSESDAEGYSRSDYIYAGPYRSFSDRSYSNNWSVKPDYDLYKAGRKTRRPTWNDHYYERNYKRWGLLKK